MAVLARALTLAPHLGRRGPPVRLLTVGTFIAATGLHPRDVEVLCGVLDRLVENGHTVVVIEHDLDVIKRADWIVDMGPDGGDGGGTVVAMGRPEEVAEVSASATGAFLRRELKLD